MSCDPADLPPAVRRCGASLPLLQKTRLRPGFLVLAMHRKEHNMNIMQTIRLPARDFEAWRAAARALLLKGVRPDAVRWEEGAGADDLFALDDPVPGVTERAVGTVPRKFLDLAQVAYFHDDPKRPALLYRLLFRLQKDHHLLDMRSHPDVSRLYQMVAEIRDDVARSKTEAGRRLRRAMVGDGERHSVAWEGFRTETGGGSKVA